MPEAPAVQLPDSEPSVSVFAEPVSGSRLGRLVGKIPVLRRLRKSAKAADPVPLYRVYPTLKAQERQLLKRPVSIDVKVYVGESGQVKDAEVLDSLDRGLVLDHEKRLAFCTAIRFAERL